MPDATATSDLPQLEPCLNMARLWCLPLALGAWWFKITADAIWPQCQGASCRSFHEPHDQLVVPDPIEDTGEHALFA